MCWQVSVSPLIRGRCPWVEGEDATLFLCFFTREVPKIWLFLSAGVVANKKKSVVHEEARQTFISCGKDDRDYFTQAESHFTESHATVAHFVESHAIESQQAVAFWHFTESQQTAVESQVSLLAVLFPQEAKEIAANAAKTNTKFFIFFFSFLL